MTRFASKEEEAEERYGKYRSVDPFPGISPAVLNIADISDYVAAAGIIFPFHISDKEILKPASYGIPLRGRCIYWDASGRRNDFILSDLKLDQYPEAEYRPEFNLERNAIAFVTLEPTIRLPDYLALRFNLAIREVYRGFLLGTGPLVDPGFTGKLSFPLHNLTDRSYRIRAGEQIVWVEVTKISALRAWDQGASGETRQGKFYEFPPRKNNRKDVLDYLIHASSGEPVRSSIPIDVEKASKAAQTAGRSVKRYSWIGGITLFLAFLTIIYAGYQLTVSSIGMVDGARKELNTDIEQNKTTKETIREVQMKVDTDTQITRKALTDIQQRIDNADSKTQEEIAKLEQAINELRRRK